VRRLDAAAAAQPKGTAVGRVVVAVATPVTVAVRVVAVAALVPVAVPAPLEVVEAVPIQVEVPAPVAEAVPVPVAVAVAAQVAVAEAARVAEAVAVTIQVGLRLQAALRLQVATQPRVAVTFYPPAAGLWLVGNRQMCLLMLPVRRVPLPVPLPREVSEMRTRRLALLLRQQLPPLDNWGLLKRAQGSPVTVEVATPAETPATPCLRLLAAVAKWGLVPDPQRWHLLVVAAEAVFVAPPPRWSLLVVAAEVAV